jgi:hypothetical protein
MSGSISLPSGRGLFHYKENTVNDSTQNQLIANVARDLVAQLAPEELPLFQAHSAAYFKDPQKVLKGQRGEDEMLGFGTGEAISLLTPIALTISVEVIKFVTEEVKKSFKAESSSMINDLVKSMFEKYRSAEEKKEKPASTLLTLEQLKEVRKIAIAKARKLKLPESKANQLADALIADLVATG